MGDGKNGLMLRFLIVFGWLEQINNLKYFTSSKDYSQYDVNYLYIIFNEDGEPTDVGIQIEGVKNKKMQDLRELTDLSRVYVDSSKDFWVDLDKQDCTCLEAWKADEGNIKLPCNKGDDSKGYLKFANMADGEFSLGILCKLKLDLQVYEADKIQAIENAPSKDVTDQMTFIE